MNDLSLIRQNIYLDEFGTPSLKTDAQNVTNFYIIAGIIFDAAKRKDIENAILNIIKKNNVQGELKSSKLKGNPQKRIQILQQLSSLDINYLGIVVNKEKINPRSGLQWKRSFIKHTTSLLYSSLNKFYNSASIYTDAQGSQDFSESFKRYITQKEPDLFSDDMPHVVDSKTNILIQTADLISGTLGYIYDNKYKSEDSKLFWSSIKEKVIFIEEWPTNYEPLFQNDISSHPYNYLVQNYAERQADLFILKYASDSERQLQVATLKYLLFKKKFDFSEGYIFADSIIEHLQNLGLVDEISKQTLRTSVISKLRQAGVIISSCAKGYKIPSTHDDLIAYVEQINGKVVPMLNLLNKARDQFLATTKNELDIAKNFKNLISLLECQKAESSDLEFKDISL